MKKFIYAITLTILAAASISSCTEENIKPQDGGGGGQKGCQFGCP